MPCGFALNVRRVQFDQLGSWARPSRQPHGFDAGGVAARRILGTRRQPPGGLSYAKAGRDVRRCHPGGGDACHRRYRDGFSAQQHRVGGRKWPNAVRPICRRTSDPASSGTLGKLVAVSRPPELAPILQRAGGLWSLAAGAGWWSAAASARRSGRSRPPPTRCSGRQRRRWAVCSQAFGPLGAFEGSGVACPSPYRRDDTV